MREIKFRGWNGKRWTREYTLNELMVEQIEFNGLKDKWCQFTGLKDKNDKEIYEGDVVHCEDEMSSVDKVWRTDENKAVTFENGAFRFDTITLGDMMGAHPLVFEVIGNIYENPDLLTKQPTV